MSEPTDKDLQLTRAALAPTLNATAAILPLIAKVAQARFPVELTERWRETSQQLAAAWANRLNDGDAPVRRAVFALCGVAVELADADCLALSEALASATDLLEDPDRAADPRLLAAMAAACEGLVESGGVEKAGFAARAQYVSKRLQSSLQPTQGIRTPTLDKLFVDEACEQLHAMDAALDALPPDPLAIRAAAEAIIAAAAPLEFYDLIDRARVLIARLIDAGGQPVDLDDPATRNDVLYRIALIDNAIADIPVSSEEARPQAPIVFGNRPKL